MAKAKARAKAKSRARSKAKTGRKPKSQPSAARHSFGRTRPGADGSFALHKEPPRNTSFRPLSPPTGNAPYRLDLKSIISPSDYQNIVAKRKLTSTSTAIWAESNMAFRRSWLRAAWRPTSIRRLRRPTIRPFSTSLTLVLYLIAGNGGYHNLHSIMKVNGERMIAPVVFNDKDNDPMTLERYCDDHWGFVRLEVTDTLVTGRFYQVPRPQESFSKGNQLVDYFEFDWKARKYVSNALSS